MKFLMHSNLLSAHTSGMALIDLLGGFCVVRIQNGIVHILDEN